MASICLDSAGTITRSLQEWRDGDSDALCRLATVVYRELDRLSRSILSPHRPSATMQPAVLVHELYLRLPEMQTTDWRSRAQFFNTAARMMRNILVDHARSREALKRGAGAVGVDIELSHNDQSFEINALLVNEALEQFAKNYPRHARCVELRFFGGLTAEETVEALRSDGIECSVRTVERDWNFSKAWLQKYIGSI
jgi:RNA polymerase sigma factor (TIGR02999 family)